MKICVFGSESSIHTQKWMKYFIKKGYDVHLISFHPVNIPGVKVHSLNSFTLFGFLPGFLRPLPTLFNLRFIPKLRKMLLEINPDILHGHYLTGCAFFFACSKVYPLVVSAWGSDVLIDSKRWWGRKMIRWVCHKADIINSASDQITSELITLGISKNKIKTFQYGVDTDLFQPNLKLRSKKIRLISTRSLYPIYNIQTLIMAMKIVVKHFKNIELLIVGAGPTDEELKNLATKLELSKYIKFKGKISHEKVAYYLKLSNIYISTSLSDGTSLALLEALSTGTFPIVTDIPANREWIQHEYNGFLFKADNHQELAKHIIKAVGNKKLARDAYLINKNLIYKKGSYNKNMEQMEKIYLSLSVKNGKN